MTNTNKKRNKFRIEGDIAYMTIAGHGTSLETMISVADVERVASHPQKWFFEKRGTHPYVRATARKDGRKTKTALHRLLTNAPDGMVVDHINHNTLDNRRENLRIVTLAENSRNRRAIFGPASGVRGVMFIKNRKRWVVNVPLGYFATLDEASQVARRAEELLKPLRAEIPK